MYIQSTCYFLLIPTGFLSNFSSSFLNSNSYQISSILCCLAISISSSSLQISSYILHMNSCNRSNTHAFKLTPPLPTVKFSKEHKACQVSCWDFITMLNILILCLKSLTFWFYTFPKVFVNFTLF